MKANELMIGDWVNTPNGISRVIYIAKYSGIYTDNTNVGEKLYSPHEINPIPLTPKILEKNGFERSKVFVEWKYENDDAYMIYKPFPYFKIQMEECVVAFPCKYVHQLQHALHLCEIEKEIEL